MRNQVGGGGEFSDWILEKSLYTSFFFSLSTSPNPVLVVFFFFGYSPSALNPVGYHYFCFVFYLLPFLLFFYGLYSFESLDMDRCLKGDLGGFNKIQIHSFSFHFDFYFLVTPKKTTLNIFLNISILCPFARIFWTVGSLVRPWLQPGRPQPGLCSSSGTNQTLLLIESSESNESNEPSESSESVNQKRKDRDRETFFFSI